MTKSGFLGSGVFEAEKKKGEEQEKKMRFLYTAVWLCYYRMLRCVRGLLRWPKAKREDPVLEAAEEGMPPL